ncbi:MAG: 6-hydroxycyclohex-1-ene-1-carbonyl-CoA dehydrogenase [Patescibacteria group bacterium]
MTEKMTAWQMTEPNRPLEKVELPMPEPGEGEVLLRVAGCGVCHTDLGFFFDGVRIRSALPLVLGHEISGIVISAGKGAEEWAGKAVIVPAVMPCGTCDVCKRGKGNICPIQKMPGNDIQGGFASHIMVPARDLCEVPMVNGKPKGESGVSLAELSVIADALTTPYQAIKESRLGILDTAIFVGVGGVGGFGTQIAKALGALVIAIDIDQKKLELLQEHKCVDAIFDPRAMPFKDLREEVSGFVKSQGRRRTEWKIFETSGTADGQKTAFGLLPYGGYLSVVGFTMDTVEIRLSNLMAFHATIKGTWGCLPENYHPAMWRVLSGKVQISPFVKTYPLDDINAVFEMVHNREIIERAIMVP